MNYLSESILFQLQIGSISLYRSPSQTADKFDSFFDNLKLNLETMTDNNPFLVVAIGDFNARSSSWCIMEILMHDHQASASMIKVIMKKLK